MFIICYKTKIYKKNYGVCGCSNLYIIRVNIFRERLEKFHRNRFYDPRDTKVIFFNEYINYNLWTKLSFKFKKKVVPINDCLFLNTYSIYILWKYLVLLVLGFSCSLLGVVVWNILNDFCIVVHRLFVATFDYMRHRYYTLQSITNMARLLLIL